MSIQISVMLWTVICFFLLMLILRNLLFKPLITCMDRRKKRLADAADKQRSDEEQEKEARARREASLCEQTARAKTEAERKVAEEQVRTEKAIAARLAEEQEACRAYRTALEAEKKTFEKQTEEASKRLGEMFVSRFAS